MPLVKLEHLSEKKAYGVWEIQESLETLKENYLQNTWPSFKSALRLKQWITGKILIQSICSQKEIPFNGIGYNTFGKPVLVNSNYKISISHKDSIVVGIVSDQNVGIDIEYDLQKLERVKDKFLNVQEKDLYSIDYKNLLPIWAAKECVYKMYSEVKLNFKDQIIVKKISKNRVYGCYRIQKLSKAFELAYEKYKNNVVAFNL